MSKDLENNKVKQINAFFPFVFSDKIDPRAVYTVGDQVVSEHLYAFHVSESIRGGFNSIFSDIEFDEAKNIISIRPKYKLSQTDGSEVDIYQICSSLEASLKGTLHAPYGTLLKNIECLAGQNKIEINMTGLPANIRYLFTLPDFSIFNRSLLPQTQQKVFPSTGPYRLEKLERSKVVLKRNQHYPEELVANKIETVTLNQYNSGPAIDFIKNMDPSSHHLAYFFGYAVDDGSISMLKEKGYSVEIFPTEWVVQFGIKSFVPMEDRILISKVIDELREGLSEQQSLAQKAYSISPSDRPFGLNKNEYYNVLKGEVTPLTNSLSQSWEICTLETWYNIPFFRSTLDSLINKFPNLKLKLFKPQDIAKLFSKEAPLILTPLGISKSDPLSNLSFLLSTLDGFSDVVSKEMIANISTEKDVEDFDQRVKNIESGVVKKRLLLPIAHFPGVMSYRNDFTRDEKLGYSWGLQAWSFHVP